MLTCTCEYCVGPADVAGKHIPRVRCKLCGTIHIPKTTQQDETKVYLCKGCWAKSKPCEVCGARFIEAPYCGCTVRCILGNHYVLKTKLASKGLCLDCLRVPEVESNLMTSIIQEQSILAGRAATRESLIPSDASEDGITSREFISGNVRDYLIRTILNALAIYGPDKLYLHGISDAHNADLWTCPCCLDEFTSRGYSVTANLEAEGNKHRVGISRSLRISDLRRPRLIQDLNEIFGSRQTLSIRRDLHQRARAQFRDPLPRQVQIHQNQIVAEIEPENPLVV